MLGLLFVNLLQGAGDFFVKNYDPYRLKESYAAIRTFCKDVDLTKQDRSFQSAYEKYLKLQGESHCEIKQVVDKQEADFFSDCADIVGLGQPPLIYYAKTSSNIVQAFPGRIIFPQKIQAMLKDKTSAQHSRARFIVLHEMTHIKNNDKHVLDECSKKILVELQTLSRILVYLYEDIMEFKKTAFSQDVYDQLYKRFVVVKRKIQKHGLVASSLLSSEVEDLLFQIERCLCQGSLAESNLDIENVFDKVFVAGVWSLKYVAELSADLSAAQHINCYQCLKEASWTQPNKYRLGYLTAEQLSQAAQRLQEKRCLCQRHKDLGFAY